MAIPECPWRFGEPCRVTDFITPNNIGVERIAQLIKGDTPDKTIENACEWIIPYKYPLDSKGNPCASGMLKQYQTSWCKWEFSKYVPYMWVYPNEVILTKRGICIATTCLFVSVLRNLGVDAWAVLGEVHRSRKEDNNELIGYHAWAKVMYKDEWHTVETTIEEPVTIIFPERETNFPITEWAQARNLYYTQQARMREGCYVAGGDYGNIIVQLIGLPISYTRKFGPGRVMSMMGMNGMPLTFLGKLKAKQIENEWRHDELQARSLIAQAYRVKD